MKAMMTAIALLAGLFVQAGETVSAVTDFPVELLGDLNGMNFPRTSETTTGQLIQNVADLIAPDLKIWESKATRTNKRARKYFIHAIGEALEIADKNDFIQLARDYGYEVYDGKNESRKVFITGFYNSKTEPTINNAVSRTCVFAIGPLDKALGDLNDILALNWNGSFLLDIEILGVSLLSKLANVDIYIDRGDMTMLRGFLYAAEGALYLARGIDFSTTDYDTAMAAVVTFFSDCQDRGMSPIAAFDASPLAHLKIKSVADLQTARSRFQSAFADFTAGDKLLKARQGKEQHLMTYETGGLDEVMRVIMKYKDDALSCLDQLIAPVDLASATVPVKPLEMAYTGKPLSPLIGTVTVGGVVVPYELAGTTSATEVGTYELTVVGYGRTTGSKNVAWKIVIPPPSLLRDGDADIRKTDKGGYVIRPSSDAETVEVSIPLGLDAKSVTVEVSPEVKSVKPNGAALHVVRDVPGQGTVDISGCLDFPVADKQGTVDLTKAVVKEEIVREALNTSKDAVIRLNSSELSLTTAPTRPGLVYTLKEGTTLGGMKEGASKVGDGQPWTPPLTVRGGTSGFYTIGVTK